MNGCPIDDINPMGNPTPEERVMWGVRNAAAKRQNDRVLKSIVKARGPVRIEDANGTVLEASFRPTETASFSYTKNQQLIDDWDVAHPHDQIAPRLKIGSTELTPLLSAKKRLALADLIQVDIEDGTTFRIGEANGDAAGENE